MPKGQRNIPRIEEDEISESFVKEYPLTPMQKEIIELIYNVRAAETRQIARILGASPMYTRKALRELYVNRFLDRRFPWEKRVKENLKGTVEGIYFLDEAGKLAVSGLLDMALRDVKWRPTDNLIKYEKLRHTLECTEILAKIFEECRNAGFQGLEHTTEKHLWIKFSYQNAQYELCPDIYVRVLKDTAAYSFFVENDEATMDVKSFLAKIPKYDNYKISGQYEMQYEVFPRVLVITTSKERALRLAKEVYRKQKSKVEFLFTWHDIFYEKPFSDKTFIHTSVETFPRTYSMFDEIPEAAKVGLGSSSDEPAD